MHDSGLGNMYNIRTRPNTTLEDLILLTPEERLKEINNFEPTKELLERVKYVIPGNTDDLVMNIIGRNINLLLDNTDLNKDILFINDFYRRYKMVDDINTKRHMSIALSDFFEQRLLFLKEKGNMKQVNTGTVTTKELEFYKQLVDIFSRDKKTLVTLIRIYPSLIQGVEDIELSKIIYAEVLADILKDNINPVMVMRVLTTFLNHLDSISANHEDTDWFILTECTFYLKRMLYSINDIDELHPIITYCYNGFKNSPSIVFKKLYIKVFEILHEIIKDAVGNDFKNKFRDITSISMNELNDRIQLAREYVNKHPEGSKQAILSYMNTLGEILMNYNKLFADSDIMQGVLSESNNEYAFALLTIGVDTDISQKYKYIIEVIEYLQNLLNAVEPELIKYVNRTLSKITKDFEAGRFYIKDKLISKGFKIKDMKNKGFLFVDGSFASYNDLQNTSTRDIRRIYPTIKDMLNVITDARYSMAAKDMMRNLVQVADVVGRSYDGHEIHKLFEANILDYDKEKFIDSLCDILFGFVPGELDLSKLYNIEYANKLLASPRIQVVGYKNIVRNLDLDSIYRLREFIIGDNINIEDGVEDAPLFIEDLDFSDYDFGDSILSQEVDIFDLSVFQILRQITHNNLNLLTTNLSAEHDLYLSVTQMMDDVLGNIKSF